jgi:hypothetical protein
MRLRRAKKKGFRRSPTKPITVYTQKHSKAIRLTLLAVILAVDAVLAADLVVRSSISTALDNLTTIMTAAMNAFTG